jgi:hypothetical protein
MAYRCNGDPRLVNNPFLSMIDLMEPLEPEPAPRQAAAVNDQGASGRVKLPKFWPHAPGIWFARAELRFEVSQLTGERQKFAYMVDALPYESLCLVADLVESPPANFSYTILKERLMMSHQLSPVQRAMKLMDLPDLGDRRPSQLLADFLQDCPPGEQGTAFFRGAFLKRLPAHIQVHLSQVDSADLKGSFADLTRSGHHRYIWSGSRTACGGHAAIFGGSTCRPGLIVTRALTSAISQPDWLGVRSFQSWISARGTITYQCERKMSVKWQS